MEKGLIHTARQLKIVFISPNLGHFTKVLILLRAGI